jgi:hypothetical protein
MKILIGTRLPKLVLLATCEGDMKLFKTVEPAEDGTVTVVRHGHTVTYPGPIGYIERDGKIYPEEPVLTSIAMMPYWDFVDQPDAYRRKMRRRKRPPRR